jgi:hypothetical protein
MNRTFPIRRKPNFPPVPDGLPLGFLSSINHLRIYPHRWVQNENGWQFHYSLDPNLIQEV